MKLIKPIEKHLVEIMSWFANEQELAQWSGPNFRYPYDLSSFSEDLKLNVLNSSSLVTENKELLAFGQFYQRLGKCHLARLVVNPEYRGKGFAFELMRRLCELGVEELNVTGCSLFVLEDNTSAIRAYQNYGFEFTDYPGEIVLENCLYMVKA